MNSKTFFKYYLPALKKALDEDHINYGFLVKSPSWFYPENISGELENYEDRLYDEYPLVEKVAYYFDAKSHGFSEIFHLPIEDYRQEILRDLSELEKEYNISDKQD